MKKIVARYKLINRGDGTIAKEGKKTISIPKKWERDAYLYAKQKISDVTGWAVDDVIVDVGGARCY